jgi:hypothetical protein
MKFICVFALTVSLTAPALAQAPAPAFRDRATIQAALASSAASSPGLTRHASFRTPRIDQGAAATTGKGPWAKRHAVLLGSVAGFLGGFAIGVKTCRYPTAEGNSCDDYTYPANAQLLGGFTIGGLGAAIGAGVGWIIKASR